MRFDSVVTVFRKELTDVLRDRRTLFTMLVIPTLAVPLLMWTMVELGTKFAEKLAREQVTVLVLNKAAAPELVNSVAERANPVGRALRLTRMLQRYGLSKKDLAMVAGEDPRAFERLLAQRGIDPGELREEIMGSVDESDFSPTPANIIAQAFPPNFRLVFPADLPDLDLGNKEKLEGVLLEAVRTNRIAAVVQIPDQAGASLAAGKQARVQVFYLDSSDRSTSAFKGLRRILTAVGKEITARRLQARDLPARFARPVRIEPVRLPGPGMLIKLMGQLLPYMILIFSFTGALYPAIDLGAGEKERGTLETLLVAPVSRLAVVLGKFGVILLAAVISAVLATASLAVSLQLGVLPDLSILTGSQFSFSLTEALVTLLMVLPMAGIFSALLLALSVFARSFKEAQNYASPLYMLFILPAMVSFLPGVDLDWTTASIPVVNVTLALKEIFTGNLDQHWGHVGLIFVSTCVFAGLLLWFSAWWFRRETVLFRS